MESEAQPQPRQYVKYTFFKVHPEWRALPAAERAATKTAFIDTLTQSSESIFTRTYSCVGMRADTDFLVWQAAPSLEAIQAVIAGLLSTPFGPHLDIAHSYLSMTKRSIYVDEHQHTAQDGQRLRIRPADRRYFFVYPFWKTHAWYQLPLEERQEMMTEHIRVGHKYPTVKINTSYSFGLDDQEFIVAFETDHPDHFLDLVMELRESKMRPYTERDTPIFTCIAGDPEAVLATVGG